MYRVFIFIMFHIVISFNRMCGMLIRYQTSYDTIAKCSKFVRQLDFLRANCRVFKIKKKQVSIDVFEV